MCGGTITICGSVMTQLGLSPRVRGNPWRCCQRRRLPGSIPACAGEPVAMLPTTPFTRVYPRVCWGTLPTDEGAECTMGLSPRVRGNRTIRSMRKSYWGSIPACAGEPRPYRGNRCHRVVYPRVCGGTAGVASLTDVIMGLSPRVRGNQRIRTLEGGNMRSIPACAGGTPSP